MAPTSADPAGAGRGRDGGNGRAKNGGTRRAGGPRPTREDLLRLARERYLAGEPLEMGQLADTLGVSRATVYRWGGNQESLLGEVLWSFAEQAIDRALREAPGRGVPYLLGVFERVLESVDRSDAVRRMLRREPEPALRVLTSGRGVVQPRTIAALRDAFQREIDRGAFRAPMDLDSLCYATVRIGEAFLYSDTITGTPRDLHRAVDVLALLLREP
jgi:AcrR family transcriptional regulator